MKIVFHSEMEWLEELAAEQIAERIDRSIVRLTIERRRESEFPIWHVSVIVAFRSGEDIVELRLYKGNMLGDDYVSGEALKLAGENADRLRETLRGRDLDVRAGAWREPEPPHVPRRKQKEKE
jgi:hypothetical protein